MTKHASMSYELRFAEATIPFVLSHGSLDELTRVLIALEADRLIVVTDDTVWRIHGATLAGRLEALAPLLVLSAPPGEHGKTLPWLCAHLERAVEWGATRRSVVVTFGGGVPGNLGGLCATMMFRGVRFVHVPTTLMALIDSTLSLKQAVNGRLGKNLFGSFRAPEAIVGDSAWLATLPPRELRSGLCELIKNGLAIRPDTLADLRAALTDRDLLAPQRLDRLVRAAIESKVEVMRDDRLEQRTGLVLEYGHTVGHAIELCDHRRRGHAGISHGEAVGLGMLAASRVAEARGVLAPAHAGLHRELLEHAGAATTLPAGVTVNEVLEVIHHDNKRGYLRGLPADQVAMILLTDLGRPLGRPELPLVPVGIAELAPAIAALAAPALAEAA
jgi:3-dehydroquinate synthase/2-deoxy-scyllo-inosose synthase